MAKWYLDSVLENKVNKSVKNAHKKHEIFLKENASQLKKIEMQKELCRKLNNEGKKEEAKKLFHIIKESERELYSHY